MEVWENKDAKIGTQQHSSIYIAEVGAIERQCGIVCVFVWNCMREWVETERGAVLALRPKCTSAGDGGVEKERCGEDDDDGRGVGCDDNDYDDDFCPCVVCLWGNNVNLKCHILRHNILILWNVKEWWCWKWKQRECVSGDDEINFF